MMTEEFVIPEELRTAQRFVSDAVAANGGETSVSGPCFCTRIETLPFASTFLPSTTQARVAERAGKPLLPSGKGRLGHAHLPADLVCSSPRSPPPWDNGNRFVQRRLRDRASPLQGHNARKNAHTARIRSMGSRAHLCVPVPAAASTPRTWRWDQALTTILGTRIEPQETLPSAAHASADH